MLEPMKHSRNWWELAAHVAVAVIVGLLVAGVTAACIQAWMVP